LAAAGANLATVLAKRSAERPGEGVVFVAPLRGAKQVKAAKAAGFAKLPNLVCLRVDGPDRKGLGARIAQAVGDAGINIRGLTGNALNGKSVIYVSFDGAAAAAKAGKIIKRL
jgi:hypothetical protein